MDLSEFTKEGLYKLHDEVQAEINKRHQQQQLEFQERVASGKPFTDDELVYAAYNRCPCGHGLAYPKDCGGFHYWDCAGILKGEFDKTATHTGKLPFASYSIKSEGQPSARGATTRGTIIPENKPKAQPEEGAGSFS